MAATALGGLAVAALIVQRRQLAALELDVKSRLSPAMYVLLKDGCGADTLAKAKQIMDAPSSD